LINKIYSHIYYANKEKCLRILAEEKNITGRGFVDALLSVFNLLKASAVPAIRSIGSYLSNNKDLIAKPLLGVVGSLADTGLTAGVPALISHIMNKNKKQ